ncbi:MAG: DUF3857 domain-containing protein [Archangium sp.]|nr:DUF3857 domain-containing protein [Archangium sp.]
MSRALVLLLLCSACASSSSWAPLEPSTLRARKPDEAKRVYLLDEQEVRFSADPKTGSAVADVTEHVRVQGLVGDALQHTVSVEFDHTFYGRPELRGRVVFPDGTEKELDRKKLWDAPAWSSALLYTDTRSLRLPVPIVPRDGVLEYETKQRMVDLKPLQFHHVLGGDDPVRLSRFSVVAPRGWEIEWKWLSLGQAPPVEPTITDEGELRRWVWEQKDLPGRARELHGVAPWFEAPRVVLRLKRWVEKGQPEEAFATPKELSAWLWEKTHALSAPDEAMRATVSKVLAGAGDDPRERTRRLYDYACARIQYCYIHLGYGGWFPNPATAVERNSYGDCKDKANYLKGLLEAAQIPSRLTMIYSHDGYPRAYGLPSLAANFNHQILTVDLPSGPLLVDPTARTVAFGDLPVGDREATVLAVQQGGAELETAPATVPAEHREVQRFALSLALDGSLKGTFALETTGAVASALRSRLISSVPSKRREAISGWLDVSGVKVEELGSITGLELVPALNVLGSVTTRRVTVGDGQVRLLPLSSFAPNWLPAAIHHPRRGPMVLGRYHHQTSGELRIVLPGSMSVKTLPARFERSSRWLDYQLVFSDEGGTLVARRELTLKQRLVPAAEHADLMNLLEQIHLAENAPVLLSVAP